MVYSEKVHKGWLERVEDSGQLSVWTLIVGHRKLVWQGGDPELYDLVEDPGEQRPLGDRRAINELARRARRVQQDSRDRRHDLGVPLQGETETLDAGALEELKALGYIR